MSSSHDEARKIFWSTPELVDKLVPFLDAKSLSSLAQAHRFTAKVLEGVAVWSKLVRRCVPYTENRPEEVQSFTAWIGSTFKEKKTNLNHLVKILKEIKNPKVPLRELLHVICDRFPPVIDDWDFKFGRHPQSRVAKYQHPYQGAMSQNFWVKPPRLKKAIFLT